MGWELRYRRVTSNTSSLPEVASDEAILVDPSDVAQIVDAMRLVLTQPALAAALRVRGLARAAQFTWQHTARETIAVYGPTPSHCRQWLTG